MQNSTSGATLQQGSLHINKLPALRQACCMQVLPSLENMVKAAENLRAKAA